MVTMPICGRMDKLYLCIKWAILDNVDNYRTKTLLSSYEEEFEKLQMFGNCR
ncbi:hypothetical protein CHS0354_007360, partial [Potamilus streckersoni]